MTSRFFETLFVLSALCAPLAFAQAPIDAPVTWPQKFSLRGPELATFGIPAQPGSLQLSLQWKGGPLRVTLHGGAAPLERVFETSPATLDAPMSTQDVARSPLWHVVVATVSGQSESSGVIAVRAPAISGDALARLMSDTRKSQAVEKARADAAAPALLQQSLADNERATAASRQQFNQQQIQQLSHRFDALRVRLRPTGVVSQAPAPGAVLSRGLEGPARLENNVPANAARTDGATAVRQSPLARPPTQFPIQNAPAVTPPPPAIAVLSVSAGRPGDPVSLAGTAFGAGGQLRFIVAQNMDVPAVTNYWSDRSVFATVPEAIVALGYQGQVYIVRADGVRSAPLPFHFEPALEMRELRATMNRVLAWPYYEDSPAYLVNRKNLNIFTGFNGEDQLFTGMQLSNGWIVDFAGATCGQRCAGGAYVSSFNRGSGNPLTHVRWWLNAAPFLGLSIVDYTFVVRIVGPKALPDGIVCTTPVCGQSASASTDEIMEKARAMADALAQMQAAANLH